MTSGKVPPLRIKIGKKQSLFAVPQKNVQDLLLAPQNTAHDRVRVEVIESSSTLVVHVFPKDPKDVKKVWLLCQDILPKKFPDGKGDCSIVDSPVVPPSVCIIMPIIRMPVWASHFFRTRFAQQIAKGLDSGPTSPIQKP